MPISLHPKKAPRTPCTSCIPPTPWHPSPFHIAFPKLPSVAITICTPTICWRDGRTFSFPGSIIKGRALVLNQSKGKRKKQGKESFEGGCSEQNAPSMTWRSCIWNRQSMISKSLWKDGGRTKIGKKRIQFKGRGKAGRWTKRNDLGSGRASHDSCLEGRVIGGPGQTKLFFLTKHTLKPTL